VTYNLNIMGELHLEWIARGPPAREKTCQAWREEGQADLALVTPDGPRWRYRTSLWYAGAIGGGGFQGYTIAQHI